MAQTLDLRKIYFNAKNPKDCDEMLEILSIYARRGFIITERSREVRVSSVASFIQGIKHRNPLEFSVFNPRTEAFDFHESRTKKFARDFTPRMIEWNGQEIPYGSKAHQELIEQAMQAKFDQNIDAMNALVETAKRDTLIQYLAITESPFTPLSGELFYKILVYIREKEIAAR